ncbi:hypothetical protein [Burkholderia sp. Leaf177]|uniref:hypothetical protein n=1 Tax=Burkholderia sp. Leaf177 TaxID=1736287 RepID=UPI000AAF2089|nr:hypothetical protein [Burkholderia sp. Leaf177]
MWLLAFFHAETAFGRVIKISAFAVSIVMLFAGLVLAPQTDVAVAVSLLVLALLWVHGYMDDRRESPVSSRCVAEIRADERRIRMIGGGVDLVLRLASRTLNVNRVSKEFISSDAPGEFQRLRSGSFEWPVKIVTKERTPRDVEPEAPKFEASKEEMMRWSDFAPVSPAKTASSPYVVPYTKAVAATEHEIAFYWAHPGHGERLLFTVSGPADQYEEVQRAFSTFSAWIDEEEDARLAIERRQEVEAWQRDWETNRLAEESEQTRRRGEVPAEETLAPVLAKAGQPSPSASRRW